MILDVPVHDWVDPMLLGLSWGCQMAMAGNAWRSKTIHVMARKKRMETGGRVLRFPLRTYLQ
jgi:hypothetical protein